ncbi:hypothetical protein EDC01DRAFT_777579 [Geopyxis carbonaria]|nr:hypothetical protein EDC01DRAFT_777579 [Geopyxis carbonaria]
MTTQPPAYSVLDPTHAADAADVDGDTRVIYGGCLCTLLRYRVLLPAGAPLVVSSCACTPCAKSHSTLLAHHVAVPASTLEWGVRAGDAGGGVKGGEKGGGKGGEGAMPEVYREFEGEGGVRRGFCAHCGGGVVVWGHGEMGEGDGGEGEGRGEGHGKGEGKGNGEEWVRIAAGSLDDPRSVLEGVEVREDGCGA